MALRKLNLWHIGRVLSNNSRRYCSGTDPISKIVDSDLEVKESNIFSLTSLENNENRLLQEFKDNTLPIFTPSVPNKSLTVAAFVGESDSLKKLVRLGIDFSKIEKNDRDMATYLVMADFNRDIQPYIMFLYDQKVDPGDMGLMFTNNPSIFKESLDNLKLRFDYLRSKNFSEESIIRIVTKLPSVLTTSTITTDKQLGFIKNQFMLSAYQIRELVTKLPKLITWNSKIIEQNKTKLTGILGFQPAEVQQMLLSDPRLIITGSFALAERFDYLHNTMGFSHEHIMLWPSILRTRLHIIKTRHQFLQFVKRDQFDRTSENYISLKGLVTGSDEDFCNLAKVPVETYHEFLKTL